jgi:hypothetical protein
MHNETFSNLSLEIVDLFFSHNKKLIHSTTICFSYDITHKISQNRMSICDLCSGYKRKNILMSDLNL